ncbi:MAG: hypothetical protein WAZ18_07565 [Alphaproteobacteria bacterium]
MVHLSIKPAWNRSSGDVEFFGQNGYELLKIASTDIPNKMDGYDDNWNLLGWNREQILNLHQARVRGKVFAKAALTCVVGKYIGYFDKARKKDIPTGLALMVDAKAKGLGIGCYSERDRLDTRLLLADIEKAKQLLRSAEYESYGGWQVSEAEKLIHGLSCKLNESQLSHLMDRIKTEKAESRRRSQIKLAADSLGIELG